MGTPFSRIVSLSDQHFHGGSRLNAAEFFRESNHQIHPTEPDVQVNIKGAFESSFLVELKILYDSTDSTLVSSQVLALESLSVLVGFGTGLIRFLKKRHQSGPPVSSVETGPNVRLTWEDGIVLEINRDVPRLADEPSIRRPLNGMVKPLQREGVDSLIIGKSDDESEEITSDDLPAIQTDGDDPREILNESTFQRRLTIRTTSWQIGQKWRFNDGQGTWYAEITDKDFNARIEGREAFAKGDELECIIHSVQYRDLTGLHTEVEITRVIEHIRPSYPPVLSTPPISIEKTIDPPAPSLGSGE